MALWSLLLLELVHMRRVLLVTLQAKRKVVALETVESEQTFLDGLMADVTTVPHVVASILHLLLYVLVDFLGSLSAKSSLKFFSGFVLIFL